MAGLPKRLRLLKWGVNPSTEGRVIVNETTLAGFAAFQRERGREEVPLDFEHATVPGTPEFNRTNEPRPIAAMGRPVVLAGDGLYLDNLTWTETGRAMLLHFKDLSAAPWLNSAGVVLGLHSGALCRAGAVPGIHAFAAISPARNARLVCLAAAGDAPADPRARLLSARLDYIETLPFGREQEARLAAVRADFTAMQAADARKYAALRK